MQQVTWVPRLVTWVLAMVQGRTSLWIASNKGHDDTMQVLLSQGADINKADHEVLKHKHLREPNAELIVAGPKIRGGK